jgi:hypothetical protein
MSNHNDLGVAMTHKGLVAVVLATVLSPMAQAQSASEGLLSEANKTVFNCLINNVRQLDDGKSEVSTIAQVSANMCQSERDAFLNLLASNYEGRINVDTYRAQARMKDIEAASYFVLKFRAEAK